MAVKNSNPKIPFLAQEKTKEEANRSQNESSGALHKIEQTLAAIQVQHRLAVSVEAMSAVCRRLS